MKIPDEITVQVTLDSEDLEALRKNVEINNREEACAAIRECISFYVESHKESVSSLSGFVTTLCEFRDKDKCSEYCDGWPSEPVEKPDVPVNTTGSSTDPDAEWKKEYEERWQKAYE